MSNKMKSNLAAFLVVVVAILGIPSLTFAAYYPDRGDLRYDGYVFAESYFRWTSPGPWSVSDPGYEHDFGFNPNYLGGCTSWTDLPYGYDDCRTAGYYDPSNQWIFSFGSYHTKNSLQANRNYWGSWNFYNRGTYFSTTFNLYGQEVYHRFGCLLDNPWCMDGVPGRQHQLLSGTMNWGQSLYRTW